MTIKIDGKGIFIFEEISNKGIFLRQQEIAIVNAIRIYENNYGEVDYRLEPNATIFAEVL